MAVLTWTDQVNGASLLTMRTAYNAFNTSATTQVNLNTINIVTNASNISSNDTDIAALNGRVTTNEADIIVLENPDSTKYTPQITAPTYVEGQTFYNDVTGTFDVQGKYPDVTLQVGREEHMEVLNNTGAIITNGLAVAQSGVLAGQPTIKLAIANTFDNARILGITTHDIGIGETGIITTFGEVSGLNSLGVTTGVPLFLSDTIPGTFVETAPSIISRVGGMIVADALNGKLFVYIINNKNLPSVFGGMQGQTIGNETYNVTTTAQDLINFEEIREVVITVDELIGQITVPNDGEYRMHFTASIAFLSTTSTRSITIEFYDVTNTLIHYSHVKNIPRDATEDGLSFSWGVEKVANDVSKMRIKSSVAMDITFTDISFDIESINIR